MRTATLLTSLAAMALIVSGCSRSRGRYNPVYTGQVYYTAGGAAPMQQQPMQQPTYQTTTNVGLQPGMDPSQGGYVQAGYQQSGYVQAGYQQSGYVQGGVNVQGGVQFQGGTQPGMQPGMQPQLTQQPVLDTTVYGSPVILQMQPQVYYYQPTGMYRRPAMWGGSVIYIQP